MGTRSSDHIYYVTSLEDTPEQGTLRYALLESRNNDISFILFEIEGVIKLTSSLPIITTTVIIDAMANPVYFGTPLIEIDCNNYNGLIFEGRSNNSKIIAISITNSKNNGITLKSNNITIISNYIGIDINGNVKGNKKNGICLCNSSNNTIGVNPNNVSGYASNVISGNLENGIKLSSSNNNTIVSNFIGTNSDGTVAIPNLMNGILITTNSTSNTIGGTVYTNSEDETNNPTGSKGSVPIVAIFPPLGNLISGNLMNGILINKNSNRNILNGNFIGTNIIGNVALGNSKNGVFLSESSSNVLRGCTIEENPFVYYNVCSGNAENGILITNCDSTIIQGNFFGIASNNSGIVPNGLNGICINGNSKNTTVGGPIPLGNVCSGNKLNGISVSDTSSDFITYNTFGGLYAFGGAAPNGKNGILINSSGKNQIIRTNVFSGNTGNGIELSGKANNVLIESVICGLVTEGNSSLPNGGNGLFIGGDANNIIVGSFVVSVIPRSAFSGNNLNGIRITDKANTISVNLGFVGLSVLGENTNCKNIQNGILIDGEAHNVVVGTNTNNLKKLTNYIATNGLYGVSLQDNCYKNRIISNYIGLTFSEISAPNGAGPFVNNSSKANTNIIRNNITS